VAAAHMLFDDLPTFKAAMAATGKALAADMAHYTDIQPQVLICKAI
jgi:hypothetical protein